MRRLLIAAATALAACASEVKAPTADAGADQTVALGTVVHLDGSASSDPAKLTLAWSWSLVGLPAGSAAKLNDPAASNPSFTADVAGTYVAQLVVSNGVRESQPVQVTVTATGAVVASAGGDRRVPVGQVVMLDGSGSSVPGGLAPQYTWAFLQLPAGSAAAINNTHVVAPSFTADVAGTYVVGVTVSNGAGAAAADAVTIWADVTVGVVTPQPDFTVSAMAGGASDGITGPRGIAVDEAGAIYVAEGTGTARVTKHVGTSWTIYTQRAFLGSGAGPQDLAWVNGKLLATAGNQRIVQVGADGLQGAVVDTTYQNGENFWGLSVSGTNDVIAGSRSNQGSVFAFPASTWTNSPTAAANFNGLMSSSGSSWGAVTLGGAYYLAAGAEVWRYTSGGPTRTNVLRGGLLAGARKLLLTNCSPPKLLVAARDTGTVLAIDASCATDNCAYATAKPVVTGLANPVGLAWAGANLLVTDESLNMVFVVTGTFCSL